MKQNETFRVLQNLTYLTQLGISFVAPILLCIWVGWLLQKHLGWGSWVMIVAILLGLGGGFSSFASFYKTMQRRAQKPDKK